MIKTNYLVIGSGIAGISFALRASEAGSSVALVSKRSLEDGSSVYAQGGVAAVWEKEDSFRDHINDTIVAGDGLCKNEVVEIVIKDAPERIKELIEMGVEFTKKGDSAASGGGAGQEGDDSFDLGLEAAHNHRRVFHCGDMTGRELEQTLIKKLKQSKNVQVFENHIAIDLITTGKMLKNFQGKDEKCWGAYVLDRKAGEVRTFIADVVVLATGGAGKVYLYTSNPDVATGDGIAMAYRCGANIANMEFIQFHPTCLFNPKAKSFLISEAVRGEGGVLRRMNGEAFMEKYHPMKELAPRDIVARAIDAELKKTGDEYVCLDITHKPKDFIVNRFPNIYKKCLEFGVDMAKDPIPVVPAAHYTCGGVVTDTHGRTSIHNLYAAGEVACTGLHGSNRLASNSLLEALVFAKRAFDNSRELVGKEDVKIEIPRWDSGSARDSDELVVITQNWEEIRHLMWNYVGIVRSDKRLARAARRIELLLHEIVEYYWDFIVVSDLVELRNIATVAELIIKCAQMRKESRGLHYNINYQQKLETPSDTVVCRFKEGA
jgi:L-aspartate oxidase